MLKTVKTLAVITCILFFSNDFYAQLQLKLPVHSPIVNDVKKIIQEYPSGFNSITGALIRENEQSADYVCTVVIDGAEESFITHFPSKKNIYSWQAVVLSTEDFSKAKQKYKSLFNQFNNLTVKMGSSACKLSAAYEAPTEDAKFTSSLFYLSSTEENSKQVVLELSMQFIAPMEWKIKLLLYDKERKDDERGAEKDL